MTMVLSAVLAVAMLPVAADAGEFVIC